MAAGDFYRRSFIFERRSQFMHTRRAAHHFLPQSRHRFLDAVAVGPPFAATVQRKTRGSA
jgi:hypothetical protein